MRGARTPRRRPVAAAVFLAAVVALPAIALVATRRALDGRGVPIGQPIPGALLRTTGGDWIDTAAWSGSPRLVVLFHARCPACRRQIRTLEALVRERPAVSPSAVVLLSLDPEPEAREFAAGFETCFTVTVDPSGKLARPLRRLAVPALYLLDSERRVVRSRTGGADRRDDEALVAALEPREAGR